MKLIKKIVLLCLATLFVISMAACGGDKDSGNGSLFDESIFAADSSETLAGTAETGGDVSFISRVAAFDLSAPSPVVVRVKLKNEFDYCKIQTMRIPDEQVQYSNGKLAIHQDYFAENFDSHFASELTVVDKEGKSGSIQFVVADKIIYTADELMQINANTAALGQYYVLGNDISFLGKSFTMIGCITDTGRDEIDNPFKGLFEGAGYTISDITINKAVGAEAENGFKVGLFKAIGSGGVVRNLMVKNITVAAGGGIAGGLVGINSGTIENCYVESEVTAQAWNEPCGGFVGFNVAGASISNCVAYTKVIGLGFCGGNFGEIQNSYALAKPDSSLSELGGYLHAGVEAPPYDVGFLVEDHFACNMFDGETTGCMAFEGAENQSALNNPSNLANLSTEYWNLTSGGPVLYKMFLGNVSANA